jgi:hypothetical protein
MDSDNEDAVDAPKPIKRLEQSLINRIAAGEVIVVLALTSSSATNLSILPYRRSFTDPPRHSKSSLKTRSMLAPNLSR